VVLSVFKGRKVPQHSICMPTHETIALSLNVGHQSPSASTSHRKRTENSTALLRKPTNLHFRPIWLSNSSALPSYSAFQFLCTSVLFGFPIPLHFRPIWLSNSSALPSYLAFQFLCTSVLFGFPIPLHFRPIRLSNSSARAHCLMFSYLSLQFILFMFMMHYLHRLLYLWFI